MGLTDLMKRAKQRAEKPAPAANVVRASSTMSRSSSTGVNINGYVLAIIKHEEGSDKNAMDVPNAISATIVISVDLTNLTKNNDEKYAVWENPDLVTFANVPFKPELDKNKACTAEQEVRASELPLVTRWMRHGSIIAIRTKMHQALSMGWAQLKGVQYRPVVTKSLVPKVYLNCDDICMAVTEGLSAPIVASNYYKYLEYFCKNAPDTLFAPPIPMDTYDEAYNYFIVPMAPSSFGYSHDQLISDAMDTADNNSDDEEQKPVLKRKAEDAPVIPEAFTEVDEAYWGSSSTAAPSEALAYHAGWSNNKEFKMNKAVFSVEGRTMSTERPGMCLSYAVRISMVNEQIGNIGGMAGLTALKDILGYVWPLMNSYCVARNTLKDTKNMVTNGNDIADSVNKKLMFGIAARGMLVVNNWETVLQDIGIPVYWTTANDVFKTKTTPLYRLTTEDTPFAQSLRERGQLNLGDCVYHNEATKFAVVPEDRYYFVMPPSYHDSLLRKLKAALDAKKKNPSDPSALEIEEIEDPLPNSFSVEIKSVDVEHPDYGKTLMSVLLDKTNSFNCLLHVFSINATEDKADDICLDEPKFDVIAQRRALLEKNWQSSAVNLSKAVKLDEPVEESIKQEDVPDSPLME